MDAFLKKVQERVERQLGPRGARYYNRPVTHSEPLQLRAALASQDRERIRSALKRIVAEISVGIDRSDLFLDVLKHSQSRYIKVKKLVYLYVIHVARLHPDKTILIVGSLMRDMEPKQGSLVRGLALRTLLALGVPSVMEHAVDPLRSALMESNAEGAYLKRVGVVGAAKLLYYAPILYHRIYMNKLLQQTLEDPIPAVSSTAAAVVTELHIAGHMPLLQPTEQSPILQTPANQQHDHKLSTMRRASLFSHSLKALPHASEWGQLHLLRFITLLLTTETIVSSSSETVGLSRDAIQASLPLLDQSRAPVVLTAIKLISICVQLISEANPSFPHHTVKSSDECEKTCLEKAAGALKRLAGSATPDMQFQACWDARCFSSVFPIFCEGFGGFKPSFTDEAFVQQAKLELLCEQLQQCTSSSSTVTTAEDVLNELRHVLLSHLSSSLRGSVVSLIAQLAEHFPLMSEACCDLLAIGMEQDSEIVSYVVLALSQLTLIPSSLITRLMDSILQLCINEPDLLLTRFSEEVQCAFLRSLGKYTGTQQQGISAHLLRHKATHLSYESPSIQLAFISAAMDLSVNVHISEVCEFGPLLQRLSITAVSPDVRERASFATCLLSTGQEDIHSFLRAVSALHVKDRAEQIHTAASPTINPSDSLQSMGSLSAMCHVMYKGRLPPRETYGQPIDERKGSPIVSKGLEKETFLLFDTETGGGTSFVIGQEIQGCASFILYEQQQPMLCLECHHRGTASNTIATDWQIQLLSEKGKWKLKEPVRQSCSVLRAGESIRVQYPLERTNIMESMSNIGNEWIHVLLQCSLGMITFKDEFDLMTSKTATMTETSTMTTESQPTDSNTSQSFRYQPTLPKSRAVTATCGAVNIASALEPLLKRQREQTSSSSGKRRKKSSSKNVSRTRHHGVESTEENSRNTTIVTEDKSQQCWWQPHRRHRVCRKPWSREDDDLFFSGIRRFGLDLTLVSHLFPERTPEQVRRRYQQAVKLDSKPLRDALLYPEPFDVDEALRLVQAHAHAVQREGLAPLGQEAKDALESIEQFETKDTETDGNVKKEQEDEFAL